MWNGNNFIQDNRLIAQFRTDSAGVVTLTFNVEGLGQYEGMGTDEDEAMNATFRKINAAALAAVNGMGAVPFTTLITDEGAEPLLDFIRVAGVFMPFYMAMAMRKMA